jgi:hypothetical protein
MSANKYGYSYGTSVTAVRGKEFVYRPLCWIGPERHPVCDMSLWPYLCLLPVYSVIAPSEAEVTSFAYLASTPLALY